MRVSPRWEDPRTVAGFVSGVPNEALLEFALGFRGRGTPPRCLDIGCGAARNAVALADLGFHVVGSDLSWPMLEGARQRMATAPPPTRVDLVQAPMAPLPFADRTFDLIVAHGVWNLARSDAELRAAVAEAARTARSGAGLFLFTFSRRTLPPDARPDPGQQFIYSCWNGEPQCFLTEEQLTRELALAGFVRDRPGPMTEHNVPKPGQLRAGGAPVIYEVTFVRVAG